MAIAKLSVRLVLSKANIKELKNGQTVKGVRKALRPKSK